MGKKISPVFGSSCIEAKGNLKDLKKEFKISQITCSPTSMPVVSSGNINGKFEQICSQNFCSQSMKISWDFVSSDLVFCCVEVVSLSREFKRKVRDLDRCDFSVRMHDIELRGICVTKWRAAVFLALSSESSVYGHVNHRMSRYFRVVFDRGKETRS
jgi:hypothetical protein